MNRRRGGVLIVTLAVLSGLVAVLAGAAASQRLAFRAGLNRIESRRAQIAAESAVTYAIASLVEQSKTQTKLDDDWALLGAEGSERFVLGDASFRIQVLDVGSRLSLNHATRDQFERLELTSEQIDSLLDWREGGTTPRAEGAKDEYYNQLPEPYNAKLRRFDTVEELLLVRGFTPEVVFGPATSDDSVDAIVPLVDMLTTEAVSQNLAPNGQPKLNVNSQQATVQALMQRAQLPANIAAAIVQRRITQGPFGSIGQVIGLQGVNMTQAGSILDNLSTTGQTRIEGRLNLNTATTEALSAFPDLTTDMVDAIVSRQTNGFTRVGELTGIQGMSRQILQRIGDRFTANSQIFLVRAIGEVGNLTVAIEATVSIEGDSPRLLRLATPPFGSTQRWGWFDDADTETVLAEAA